MFTVSIPVLLSATVGNRSQQLLRSCFFPVIEIPRIVFFTYDLYLRIGPRQCQDEPVCQIYVVNNSSSEHKHTRSTAVPEPPKRRKLRTIHENLKTQILYAPVLLIPWRCRGHVTRNLNLKDTILLRLSSTFLPFLLPLLSLIHI